MEILEAIKEAVVKTSLLEWIGVITGLLYITLIAKKRISGWFFAIISSIIYTYLTFQAKIYNETLLQSFYIVMGVYGWIAWHKVKSQDKGEKFIVRWSMKTHLIQMGIGAILTLIIGYLVKRYTDDARPYLDTFSTVFSLIATFMDTRRVLDNWLYWIIIDTGLLFLYASRGFYLTGLLYFIYTIIAIFAYVYWYKSYKSQTS